MQIEVELTKFQEWFPDFSEITEEELARAYESAKSIISVHTGTIILPETQQIRAVYLACAHSFYLIKNPNLVAQGAVASATEGSVSASFVRPQFKNWLQYWLSLSPYGMELLALISQIQPPLPERPILSPYYGDVIR